MNRLVDFALFLLCALVSGAALSQQWPSKPIKIVIPFVAGGSEKFGAFMKAEVERWTKVVDRAGIKPD